MIVASKIHPKSFKMLSKINPKNYRFLLMDFEIPEAGADEYFAECAYPPKPPSLGPSDPPNLPDPQKRDNTARARRGPAVFNRSAHSAGLRSFCDAVLLGN